MTTLLDAARQALDYIVATNKSSQFMLVPESNLNKTVAALRTAIEEAEKAEPPEWLRSMCRYISDTLESGTPNERFMARTIMHILPLDQLTTLYTHPPAERKPLTDRQIDEISFTGFNPYRGYSEAEALRRFARDVERKHNIGDNNE